jgi:hypothetical protein
MASFHLCTQAEILARYKPTIDVKTLITELKRSDKSAADALTNFKNTRHIVLYYEDVVKNRTVSRYLTSRQSRGGKKEKRKKNQFFSFLTSIYILLLLHQFHLLRSSWTSWNF